MAATKKKNKVKIVLIIVGIVLLVCIGGCVILSAIMNKAASKMGLQKETAHPAKEDIHATVSTSGVIESQDLVSYDTNVTARIAEIKVKQGQFVKKGDVIITFDTDSLQEQLDQATLSAKQNQLSNQSSIEASNKTASSISSMEAKASQLEGEIAKVKQEINDLSGSLQNTTDTNMAVGEALNEKQSAYSEVLSKIQLLIDSTPETEDVTAKAEYRNLISQRDSLKATIDYLQTVATDDPNSSISQIITAKSSELANLEAQLDAQRSAIESAQAGIMTSTQKEQINVSNQLANMQVTSATTALEEGKAGIVAEKDGVIQSLTATKGSITTPGVPLFSIASTKDVKVTVNLTARDLETVSVGQKAEISFLDQSYEGEVVYISRIAEVSANGSSSVTADISIKNPDERLIYGLTAKVTIHTFDKKDVLCIPNIAINVDSEGRFVYAIEDGITVKKYITTGASDINNTEILDGIDENTVVITTVDATVQEGMPAVSKEEAAESNPFAALSSTTEATDKNATEEDATEEK